MAAIPYYADINLNGNQAISLRLENRSSIFGTPLEGMIYYDSQAGQKRLRYCVDQSTPTYVYVPRIDLAETVSGLWTIDRGSAIVPFAVSATHAPPAIGNTTTTVANLSVEWLNGYKQSSSVVANTLGLRDGSGHLKLADPAADEDGVSYGFLKAYVSGIRDPKDACTRATTVNLVCTRTNNVLTASANGVLTVDGGDPAVGERILVKNQTAGEQTGIYTVTNAGSAGTPWVMTRAIDADSAGDVTNGMSTWVTAGSTQANSGWLLTTPDTITLNTTSLVLVQVQGAGSMSQGKGIVISGSVVHFAQATDYTLNAIPYASSTSEIRFSGLYWNNTLSRLGISDPNPDVSLHITQARPQIKLETTVTDNTADIAFYEFNTGLGLVNTCGSTFVTVDRRNSLEVVSVGGAVDIWTANAYRWRFVSSANTLQANGAGTISTLTNGHLSLMPHGTGNVGIGTTSALSKLAINGGVHVGGDSDAGDNNLLVDGNTTLTGLTGTGIRLVTATTVGLLGSIDQSTFAPAVHTHPYEPEFSVLPVSKGGTGAASLTGILQGNGTSPVTALTGTVGYLPKWSATAPYLTGTSLIYDNGTNVGIATSAPLKALDVAGCGRFIGKAPSTLTGTANPTASTTLVGVGTLFTTELVIGDRITVNAETRTVIAIASATSLTVDTSFTDTGSASITKLHSIFITSLSSGVVGLVQNDVGNFGIGTTTPAVKCDINGVFYIRTGTRWGGISMLDNSATAKILLNIYPDDADLGGTILELRDAGVIRILLDTDGTTYFNGGNVGIGTISALSKLSINGGLHVGGDSDAGDNNLFVDGTTTVAGLAGTGTRLVTTTSAGLLSASTAVPSGTTVGRVYKADITGASTVATVNHALGTTGVVVSIRSKTADGNGKYPQVGAQVRVVDAENVDVTMNSQFGSPGYEVTVVG